MSTQTATKRVRRAAARMVQTVASAGGFDIVRRRAEVADPPAGCATPAVVPQTNAPERALPDTDHYVIPRGRNEKFEVGEYEVVPKWRYDIVEGDFYSPVPHLDQLPDDIFERRSALGGINLNGENAIAGVEGDLAPFIAELADVPLNGPLPPGQFFLNNNNYGPVDAELLYAMVRAVKPRRLI